MPAEKVNAYVAELLGLGYPHTAIIGRVLPEGDALALITLIDHATHF